MRLKVAIALAVIAFLLTTAGSSAWAYWSSQANVTSTAKVASLASSCTNVTSVQNASFEQPVINQSWTWIPNGGVPGWVSTDPVGIEIWQNGFEGVYTPVGNQFVELNANEAGTLSQSISTTPGQILQWSLLHRGRAGVDTMQVLIGSSNSTLVPIRTISDGTSAWGRYSGAYVVPAGQTTTELAFRAISTATGDLTVGNFMDDVSFGSGPCLSTASTISNITNPGSAAYHPGDVVQYSTTVSNIGSTLAYQSSLTAPLSAALTYKPGSLAIDGVAETDASGDDLGSFAAGAGGTGGTVTTRLGAEASATAGGSIAQGTSTTVTFQAVVTGAIGTTISYLPTANYVNGLAPLWAASPIAPTDIPVTITQGVDVGLTASTPAPATLTAGVATPTTWAFVAKNNGTAVANNVVVHLTAPTGYSSTTAPQVTGGTCVTTSATTADCTIGNLAAGATQTVTLSGYAAAGTTPGAFAVTATISTTSGDPNSANNSATGPATVVADTTPPTAPTALAASATTGSGTTLKWTASTDNAGVVGYNVYRGGVLVTTVTGTTFTDSLLNPSTGYSYTVKAVDAAGNVSAVSNTVTITTTATFTGTTYYRIGYPGTSLCIDTGAIPPVSGSALIFATCDTTQYQKWAFLQTENAQNAQTNYYFVAPQVTSTLLGWDIVSTANLAKADVKTVTGTAQEWKPVVQTGGTFEFVNLSSGRCLAVNGTATAGLQLVQTTCITGATVQQFTLTGVN